MARFELEKMKCVNLSHKYNTVLGSIPLHEYMDRIILDKEDEINLTPEDDQRLHGHKIHIFLGKDTYPPMIYVHIDNEFAAQYSYFDDDFAQRGYTDW